MLRLRGLREFVRQRLSAAVEEVMGHLERTLTEFEEEMASRCGQLPGRRPGPEEQRRSAAGGRRRRVKGEAPVWSPVSDRDPDGPRAKEEEKPDSRMCEKVVNHLHQQDTTPLPFRCVRVKSESAAHKTHVPQRHRRPAEESREEEPPASVSADGEDRERGGPRRIVVARRSGSDERVPHCSEAEAQGGGDEDGKAQTDSNTTKVRAPDNDLGRPTSNKSFTCSQCGKRFGQKHHLLTHMRCHTGEKPFCCSLCGKRFTQKGNLTQHLTVHTREKPCSCPVCGERFAQKGNLTQHLTVHVREKLCW